MKKLILFGCMLCSGAFFTAKAQAVAPKVGDGSFAVTANCTFVQTNKNILGLTLAYEHRVESIFSLGGGLGLDRAHTQDRQSTSVITFNPFLRAKLDMLRNLTTPFIIFDAGYYTSGSSLLQPHNPQTGVSLTPSVGIDIGTGRSGRIRVMASMLCVMGIGKDERIFYWDGYSHSSTTDRGNTMNFKLSAGYAF